MDTNETYIKMSDCPEIQNQGSYARHGDLDEYSKYQILDKMSYYAAHNEDGYYFVGNFAEDYTSNFTVGGYVRIPEYRFGCAVRDDLPVAYKPEEIVWLPRQDQLQEMVKGCASFLEYHKCCSENSISQNLIHLFMFFLFESDMGGDFGNGDIYAKQFTSMEQLWLAFVMKENHNKVWLNGEWVK